MNIWKLETKNGNFLVKFLSLFLFVTPDWKVLRVTNESQFIRAINRWDREVELVEGRISRGYKGFEVTLEPQYGRRRSQTWNERKRVRTRMVSIDWDHLANEIVNAKMALATMAGIRLPWNLENLQHHPVVSYGGYGPRPQMQVDKLVRNVLRTCGFIHTVAGDLKHFPATRKVLERTQSRNGMNSPRTSVPLWSLVEAVPSPGRLERRLWTTRERAQRIISGFHPEITPSWEGLLHGVMEKPRNRGKAAIIAVAATLNRGPVHMNRYGERTDSAYRAAREYLVAVSNHQYSEPDTTDGVAVDLDPEPVYDRHGIQVRRYRQVNVDGIDFGLFVSFGDRSYHYETRQQDPREGTINRAVDEAVSAWGSQKAAERRHADLTAFLNGEETGASPLIYISDSLDAGNCRPGTKSWAQSHGFGDREFVPGVALLPHLSDARVRRVISARRASEVQ